MNISKNKKLVLIAPGGAGKDFLKEKLVSRGFRPSVSYTTRPRRPGEVDGKSYHFVSREVFMEMVRAGEFREFNCFGDQKWYYGTTKEDFEKSNLFIMTPSGVSALTPEERALVTVIYLNIPEDVRAERLRKRNDSDDPERRLATDRDLFRGYSDYDLEVTDPNFTTDDVLKQAQKI